MTRHTTVPPSGEELARAMTYEREQPPSARAFELTGQGLARRERPARGARPRPGAGRSPGLGVSIRQRALRTHRLMLSGELRHDSAVALEAEIDALCEAGIDALLLDLEGLRAIDATGIRVIALRCALCRRRGVQLEVRNARGGVREGFAAAGLLDRITWAGAAETVDENAPRNAEKIA